LQAGRRGQSKALGAERLAFDRNAVAIAIAKPSSSRLLVQTRGSDRPSQRRLGTVQEKRQAIAFVATNLVKVQNGRITDNWHIEDNLGLLKQMGVAKIAS